MNKRKMAFPRKAIKGTEENKQYSFFSIKAEGPKVEDKRRSDQHFTKGMPFTIKL